VGAGFSINCISKPWIGVIDLSYCSSCWYFW